MTGLLLALLGTVLAGLGARDQTLMARLAGAQGRRTSALAVALAVCCVTAAFAAWAGSTIAPMLDGETRPRLAWLALVIAGIEMLVIVPGKAPNEPTHSLGAMAFVLAAYQVSDAARLLIFAVAVVTAAPIPAGIGGALGGAITLTAAWLAPGQFAGSRVRHGHRIVGAALLVLAAVMLIVAAALLLLLLRNI
jgi:hypothetical protein